MEKINIIVSFNGALDIKNISSGETLNISKDTTISELLSFLGIIEQHKKYIIITVNNEKASPSYKLKNNDIVKLFLPIGGG